jgi:hypothetical protein
VAAFGHAGSTPAAGTDGPLRYRRPVLRRLLVGLAKVALVLVTLVCAASLGGAMGYAWPVLVPLHVLAARRSGPYGTAGWGFLAAASMAEAAWIGTYVVVGTGVFLLLVPSAAMVATGVGFIALRTRALPAV